MSKGILLRRHSCGKGIDMSLYENQYLTMEFNTDGTISFVIPANVNTTYITDISYRVNNGEWVTTTNTSSAVTISINVVQGDIVQWKGNIPFKGYVNGNTYAHFADDGTTFALYGNIMSLYWGDDFRNKELFPYSDVHNVANPPIGIAYGLFQGTSVYSAENLILPAQNLYTSDVQNAHHYNCMFKNCANLMYPPAVLPARIIGAYTYNEMFMGCTSLVRMPNMESIEDTVGRATYMSMFNGCAALSQNTQQTIHMNKATYQMCQNMFRGCTSMVNAPNIEVYELGTPLSGYGTSMTFASMFYSCTNLRTPPERFDITEVDNGTFYTTFANCSQLQYAPIINIRGIHFVNSTLTPNPGRYAFDEMFYKCTSLTDASGINVYFPEESQWYGERPFARMFWKCTSLVNGPSLHIYGTQITLSTGTMYQMCFYCQNMANHDIEINYDIDSSATITTGSDNGNYQLFAACERMLIAPRITRLALRDSEFYRAFDGCIRLTDIYIKFNTNTAGNALNSWLENCQGTAGIIHQAGTLSLPASSTSGVRSGWTLDTTDWTTQRHARMTMWFDDYDIDAYGVNGCYALFGNQLNDFLTTISYGTSANIYHYYGDTLTLDGVTYFVWENNLYEDDNPYKLLTTTDNFYELKKESGELLNQTLQPSTNEEKLQVLTVPFTHLYGMLENDVIKYDDAIWATGRHLMAIKRNQG